MPKVKQIALLCAAGLPALSAAETTSDPKPWLLIGDYEYRASDVILRSGGVTGSYGRSRHGAELVRRTDTQAVDLEYYRYQNRFDGAVAGTDRAYGDTTDVMLTGFQQWDWGKDSALQVIYALEATAEDSVALADGLRWGLGSALRWKPDPETDLALGVLLESRLENSLLPIPYVKAVWRPWPDIEVELRATGLQNGIIVRGFLTSDHATAVDFTAAYETLSFRLSDGAYGARAVAIGEVPIRFGFTQFLEASGTWFVRGTAEWVPFARHSFKHDGETMGAFQPGGIWGMGVLLGARF